MGNTKQDNSLVTYVSTSDTLKIVQAAMKLSKRTDDTALSDAAESVLSFLVLYLKLDRVTLTGDLRRHYNYLLENVK